MFGAGRPTDGAAERTHRAILGCGARWFWAFAPSLPARTVYTARVLMSDPGPSPLRRGCRCLEYVRSGQRRTGRGRMQLVTRHRRRDRAGGGGAVGRPAPDDERRAQRAERAGRAGAGDRHPDGGRRGARVHAHRDRPRGPRARPRGRHRPADLLAGGAASRPRVPRQRRARHQRERGTAPAVQAPRRRRLARDQPGRGAGRPDRGADGVDERAQRQEALGGVRGARAHRAAGDPRQGGGHDAEAAPGLLDREEPRVRGHGRAAQARLRRADPAARRPAVEARAQGADAEGRRRGVRRGVGRAAREAQAPGPGRGGRGRLRGDPTRRWTRRGGSVPPSGRCPGSRPSTRGGSATSPAGAAGARGPVAGTPGRRRR